MPRNESFELSDRAEMILEEGEAGPSTRDINDLRDDDDMLSSPGDLTGDSLDRRTKLKLDLILLPFLSILFLLNSLDKSNIGNAETAGFTHDAGLSARDINVSLAFFFAFFVALQPVGAALGRKYGMARWVPACMSLWGLCTILHIWVRRRWQLIVLRVAIASLEAGFYPTTVSYLSLFYTRYEFAVRLGIFYGQTALAGALGGVLSWAVFSQYPGETSPSKFSLNGSDAGAVLKSWQVLFLIEGCTTIFVALFGFIWLPHSADTAWFLNAQERAWAEQRIRFDRESASEYSRRRSTHDVSRFPEPEDASFESMHENAFDGADDEAHHQLLPSLEAHPRRRRKMSVVSSTSMTADAGLDRHDIVSAVLQYKIWHLLVCNILSAIPATAFGVFLPMVVKQLSPSLNLSPAASNLLAAPPFACGAIVLFIFTRWSDRCHQRLIPILWGLSLLLVGLTLTVLSPRSNYILRYISLCILLSGCYVPSPLTVAWLTNNTPEPGKRAILLGINGWGNLAGVFSALLFTPDDEKTGYVKPFILTLLCVLISFAGFAVFRYILILENRWRDGIMAGWSEEERQREDLLGDSNLPRSLGDNLLKALRLNGILRGIISEQPRRGDEKLTFSYSL